MGPFLVSAVRPPVVALLWSLRRTAAAASSRRGAVLEKPHHKKGPRSVIGAPSLPLSPLTVSGSKNYGIY